MPPPPTCPDPVNGAYWERRRHERVTVDLPVLLHGPKGEILATAVNLSAGGVLLRLSESDLVARRPVAGRSPAFAVARNALGAHLEAWFQGTGVAAAARLVRIVCPPDEAGRVYLALEFQAPLVPTTVRRLGVNLPLAPPAPAPAPGTHPAARLTLVVAGRTPKAEPLAFRLERARTLLLAGSQSNGDPGAVARALGERRLSYEVRDDRAAVHSGSGRLHAVTVLPPPSPGVEVEILTESDPRSALEGRL